MHCTRMAIVIRRDNHAVRQIAITDVALILHKTAIRIERPRQIVLHGSDFVRIAVVGLSHREPTLPNPDIVRIVFKHHGAVRIRDGSAALAGIRRAAR